jgi:predicted  nucleic acid-binding Zn-ribbon protein
LTASNPNPIAELEALAVIDAQLKTLDDTLAQERATLGALTANLKRLQESLDSHKGTLAATEKLRNEYIAEVRSMTHQLDQSRDKLGRSRNERESNAAQREIEELRKLLRDREEEVGRLTTDCEAVRQRIEATEAEMRKVEGELGANSSDIQSKLSKVEEERAQVGRDRDAAAKRVPPAVLRKYESIRSKRGTALAKTTDGTCKACHIALPPQLYHRLRREPLLEQCPSCNRLIYFAPPTAADASGEGASGKAPEA